MVVSLLEFSCGPADQAGATKVHGRARQPDQPVWAAATQLLSKRQESMYTQFKREIRGIDLVTCPADDG